MPKNKVNDPITDQEIAFGRLVLSGTMTDRQAAEAVGLNPDSAAYTKAKPHVRAYMLEHRAAVEQQLVQQDADLSRRAVEGQRRLNLDREQVLTRLWELANLSSDMTRGSITGQVKALAMIIAMENFIPNGRAVDRLAISSEEKSPPAPAPKIHTDACLPRPAVGLRRHQPSTHRTINDPQPSPPQTAPGSAAEAPPDPGPSQSTFANRFSRPEAPPVAPYVLGATFLPDMRVPFSIKENPFARPR